MPLDKNEIKEKSDRKIKVKFLIFIGVIIFAPIIAMMIIDLFINNDNLAIGISSYIQNALIYGLLGTFCIIVALNILFKLAKERKNIKKTILGIIAISILALISFFLIRPIILDAFYLHDPSTVYLYRLSFDDEWGTGDSPTSYYLQGHDMDNDYHSFKISKDLYDKGKEMLKDGDLYAKVTYLPNTQSVIDLQLLDDPNDLSISDDPLIIDKDWHSYTLKINDVIYELPVSIHRFLENGWHIEDSASLILKGNDGPYGSYDYKRIDLISDSDQTLSVTVYNTSEDDIALIDGIVGGISMIYGNYDFAPKDSILPSGLYLGISTYEDVLDSYGVPSESNELSLTYRDDESGSYWVLLFDEDEHLDEIIVHHHPYSRDH